MLEGLEISEIYLNEVLKDNDNKRIDSEYFRKQFLNFFKNIPDLKPLSYFVKDGYRVVYESTNVIEKQEAIEKDYPYFLQATDLKTPFIDTSNLFYVHEEDWARYPKGRIVKGEILIEVKGKIDKVAIVPDNFPEKTLVTGSLFKLTVNEKISKHILLTYLISKYGTAFKDRYKTNLLISFVSKPDLYRIPVPSFGKKIQIQIDNIFDNIFESNKKSKNLYSQAETLLLETLGLNNFEPTAEAVNIKNFKESFLSSGRLDAEYYQKKYEEITVRIKSHKYDQLGNLVNIKKSIEPGSDAYQEEGVPFIRVSNLNKMGLSEPDIHLDGVKYKDVVKPRKDTILLSKDGSVGMAYKVSEDMNAITSGAILHLSVKTDEVLPDYLTLILNSKVVQMQAERDAGGSILQHWKPSEIEQVEIPIIDKQTQEKIALLVSESFMLKKQSEQLLETAKRAVEIAIEEGEEVAMRYIDDSKRLN